MTAPDTSAPDQHLDLRGLKCPLPVLRSRKVLAGLKPGAVLVVEASDPMSVIDIPHMCNEDGHALLAQEKHDDALRFTIRRGAQKNAG
ncbi:response regulator SirA [Pannonibacter phragmitetus]|uniref:sulfurtransferase TusA family protein n=1 Tax=Pannonibacter phragmitetus TaxID=121719 RepID=UPI00067CF905|nr:sulfurtransferase TusA family protein [Pannonibacter phragmitetus]KND17840.1 response regulator SirA [Pannonibacter phragmitetus]